MGFWITKFDTTVLSTKAPMQEIGLGAAALGLQSLPGGGVHDPWGADTAPVQLPYTLACSHIITAASAAAMATAYYAIRALHGKRAWLYRTPDGGTAYRDRVLARLESIGVSREVQNGLNLPVELVFSIEGSPWQGADGTVTTVLDGGAGHTHILCANDGNARVTAVVITITALVAPITSLTITVGAITSIKWADSLAIGESLVIDCGAKTIRNDGVDAYEHFTLEAGQTVDDWIRLEAGNNTVEITMVGGDATSPVVIAYRDGYY
jgi:hypothetical protein